VPGGDKAVMFKGHGAVTVGESLRESVTNVLHLEEQAAESLKRELD